MFNGVHRDTSDDGPRVSLNSVLMESSTSLQEGLIGSTASGDQTNNSSGRRVKSLSGPGRELQHNLLSIIGMTDNDGGGTGSSGEGTSVGSLVLNTGNNGSLG